MSCSTPPTGADHNGTTRQGDAAPSPRGDGGGGTAGRGLSPRGNAIPVPGNGGGTDPPSVPALSPPGLLRAGAGELGIALTDGQLRLFALYEEELRKWNRFVSLVAIKDPRDITVKHFLDSLALLSFLPQKGGLRLLDVATGGGFPGLPVKIARPDIDLYLLESARKKVSFLREVIRRLDLTGVAVIHERVEKAVAAGLLTASCDVVVSRASFPTPALLTMGSHFLRPEGSLLVMRGPRQEEAAAAIASACLATGFHREEKTAFSLPHGGDRRIIIRYRKAGGPAKVTFRSGQ